MMSKNARFLVIAATFVLLGTGLQVFAASSVPVLLDMVVEAKTHGPVLHLQLVGKLDTVHYSPQPGVWVVEMPESTWPEETGVLSKPELGIERAELTRVEEFGKTISRLTVWLTTPAQLELEPNSRGLDLVFTSIGASAGEPEPPVERESIPVPRAEANFPAETGETAVPEPAPELEPELEPELIAIQPLTGSASSPAEIVSPATEPAASLLEVTPIRSGDGALIELRGDGPLRGQAFALPAPDRIVIDLPGVVNRVERHLYEVNSPVVRRVRVAQFQSTPEPITRIVVDLEHESGHQVVETATGALVSVGPTAEGDASRPAMVGAADQLPPEDSLSGEPVEPVTEPSATGPVADPQPAAQAALELTAQETAGSSESAAPPPVDASPEPQVPDTSPAAPPSVNYDPQRGMVVSNGAEPVVVTEELPESAGETLISNESGEMVITRSQEASPSPATSQASSGRTSGHRGSGVSTRTDAVDIVKGRTDTGHEQSRSPWVADPSQLIERAPAASMVRTQAAAGPEQYEATEVGSEERRYTGDPISLTLKDADIADVLRTFSTLTNLNIVQDNVRGSVTVDLRNVPWDQALDLILKINDLGYVLENNVLRVAPLGKLAAERQAEAAMAEGEESSQPIRTVVQPLSYAKAQKVGSILERESFLLSARGSVVVDDRTNTLIIRDTVDRVDGILRLIETLDQPTTQVVIEGRVVETTRDFSHEFGMVWGFQGFMDADHSSQTGLTFPNEITVDGGVNLSRGNVNGIIGFSFADLMDTFNLDFTLSAAESDGLVKIVSTPRVTTQNLTRAQIQSGYQIPIQTQVNNTVTVTYINATLRLSVLPQITAEGTVILDINIQKQEPLLAIAVQGGTNVPIFTRDAQTELLVRDGGTTVIAGIYTINDQTSENRVPVLSKIPVIGSLFKNEGLFKRHDELLIFITPRIVKY